MHSIMRNKRSGKKRRKKRRQKKNTGKHNFHLKLKQFAGLLRTVWAQKIIAELRREGRGGVRGGKRKSEKWDWKMFFLTLMKPIRKQQPANQLCNKFPFSLRFSLDFFRVFSPWNTLFFGGRPWDGKCCRTRCIITRGGTTSLNFCDPWKRI